MSISDELKANILRYHHVEKWRVGTISRQLNVHHSTIKRVLAETGVPKRSILVQSSMIEPYVPFILDTLQKFPLPVSSYWMMKRSADISISIFPKIHLSQKMEAVKVT